MLQIWESVDVFDIIDGAQGFLSTKVSEVITKQGPES